MTDSQVIILIITHLLALAACWWLPGWAARRDAARFNANPADDDLHRVFHRQRLLERLGIFAGLALLANAVLLHGFHLYHLFDLIALPVFPWRFVVMAAGLLAAAAGIWAFRFNRLLSIARNLPYVGPDYVSADPRAAWFPDRFIWQKVLRALPAGALNDAELHQERTAYAAKLLRRWLTGALVLGGVGYGGGWVVVLI